MQSRSDKRLVLVRKAPSLSYPWGYIIFDKPPSSIEKISKIIRGHTIISVGDVVSKNLCKNGLASIVIIDNLSRRKSITWRDEERSILPLPHLNCTNLPGTLSQDCINKIKILITKGRGTLFVNGEEDLLALPSLAFCSKEMYVVYGNWKGYLQVIPCTRYFRKIAFRLLKETFKPGQATKAHF